MNINFYYKNNQHSYKHEVIITSFANALSKILDLPKTIDVCLYPLEMNVFGGVDKFHINRIGINYDLPFESIPKILTHELIHVHQKHTGILRIDGSGMCYWHGIPYTKKMPEDMTTEEYANLPWEQDVVQKQQDVYSRALQLVLVKKTV